jgi:hypothetical protein
MRREGAGKDGRGGGGEAMLDLRELEAHGSTAEGHTLQRADRGDGGVNGEEVDEAYEPEGTG